MGAVNLVLWVGGVVADRDRLQPRARARGRATRRSRSRTRTSPATRRGAAASATTGRPAHRSRWRCSAVRRRSAASSRIAGVVLVFLGFLHPLMRERTHGEGFATRAIHAGERPDPVTHAHNTPIYATATFAFDSAAEKEDAVDRSMAWEPGHVLLLADRQPDEPGARGEDRRARGRRGRRRLVVGDGRGLRDAPRAPRARATTSSSATSCSSITRVLLEEDFPRRGIGVTPVDMTDLAAVEAAITPATQDAVPGDLDQPAAARSPTSTPSRRSAHRHGLTWSSRTTRSSGRPCCGRSSTGPTSSSTPPRSSCPATATPCRASSRARRRSSTRSASRPTPSARRPARSRAGSCCAASGRSRCAPGPGRTTPRRSRPSSRRSATVEWVRYPGLPPTPTTPSPAGCSATTPGRC